MSIYYTNDIQRKDLFVVSYQELKSEFQAAIKVTDEEFLADLPKYMHLAIMICWFKEIPTDQCLFDQGIIHQIAHLMHGGDKPDIEEVRKLFWETLQLV